MNALVGDENVGYQRIRGLFPTHNPTHNMGLLIRLPGSLGSPRSLVSCKSYARYSDKGEVGGSSPPRPTIQITNKYAAIPTFPFQAVDFQEWCCPTTCKTHCDQHSTPHLAPCKPAEHLAVQRTMLVSIITN